MMMLSDIWLGFAWFGIPVTDWIIAIITIFGVIYAIKGYYKLIADNQGQQKQIAKQQFESTFFHMLSMLNEISKNAIIHDSSKIVNQPLSGMAFFDFACVQMTNLLLFDLQSSDLANFKLLAPDISKMDKETIALWEENHKDKAMIIRYEIIFKRYQSNLGHLYRYIHNLIDFAIREREQFEDEAYYINLVQAQLSSSQLKLLFYNCLSRYSINARGERKFKERIDFYEILKNIDDDEAIQLLHSEYPLTNFRFLFIDIREKSS